MKIRLKAAALLMSVCVAASLCAGCGGKASPAALSSSAPDASSPGVSSQLPDNTSSSNGTSPGSASSRPASRASGSSGSTAPAGGSGAGLTSVPEGKKQVAVTIPEGYCIQQIADRLLAYGVITDESAFLSTVNNYDFTPYHSIVRVIPSDSRRHYKLEGYLYPDTYDFYKNMNPQDAIGTMLRRSDSKIYGKYDDQTVILASVIQKEAAKPEDMQKVSAVFHNRMAKNMSLQSDATVYYLTRFYIGPQSVVDQFKRYYNTVKYVQYNCKFPAGPICSPGYDALYAASHPAGGNLLYFASDASGNYYFASTYEEQQQNIAKYHIPTGTPQTAQ